MAKGTTRVVLFLLAGIALSASVTYYVHRYVLRPAAAREEAFDAIVAGQLTADATGAVTLPSRWAAASVDGKAYLTGQREGTLWVLFVTKKGEGAQLTGVLFCNKPATARAKGALEVNYPSPAGTTANVTIRRVLNPSCYEVVNQSRTPHGPQHVEPEA